MSAVQGVADFQDSRRRTSELSQFGAAALAGTIAGGSGRVGVVLVLRGLEAVGDERLDGVGGPVDRPGEVLALGAARTP